MCRPQYTQPPSLESPLYMRESPFVTYGRLDSRLGQTCRICILLERLVPAVFHQSSGSSPPTHHGYHSTTTRAVSAEQSNSNTALCVVTRAVRAD